MVGCWGQMAMASPLSTSTVLCSKLKGTGTGTGAVCSKTKLVHLQVGGGGGGLFSPWSGLKHLGMSATPKPLLVIGKKGLWKGKVVYASLFGVGAPEALVIGVVALLVFGPKGLAEVARNLGKTLRAFQPTIRELQDVSREFKTTLEREIGLDDISTPTQTQTNNTYNSTLDPNGTRDPSKAYSSEEYLKITQEQLKASQQQQQEATDSQPQILPPEAATEPPPQNPETDNSQ